MRCFNSFHCSGAYFLDACSVIELQAFLCQLLSNFEFGMTEELKRLRRENALVMVPTLEGEQEKGVQLPLKVSFATR